jgi:hypothetical protein
LDGYIQSEVSTPVSVLIDSGADCNFVSKQLAEELNLSLVVLEEPTPLRLADGGLNTAMTHRTAPLKLRVGVYEESLSFYVTQLDSFDMILGHPWLYQHQPAVDWRSYRLMGKTFDLQGRAMGAHPRFRPVSESIYIITQCEMTSVTFFDI